MEIVQIDFFEIEENDEVYQESQRQRAIEREIRKAKTEVVALKKAGLEDSDDFAKAIFEE